MNMLLWIVPVDRKPSPTVRVFDKEKIGVSGFLVFSIWVENSNFAVAKYLIECI